MQRNFYLFAGIFVVLSVIGLTACSNNETPEIASQERPVVTIASLNANETAVINQEFKIQSASTHSVGVVRVELVVDGEIVRRDGNPHPAPNTPYTVVQSWTPQLPGSYLVQIRAYASDEVMGESDPIQVEVSSAETADSSSTATPMISLSDTPTKAVDTATPIPSLTSPPAPTEIPAPAVHPTASATPTPGVYEPTGIEPQGLFREIWDDVNDDDERLGYPTSPEFTEQNYAKQYFERGMMFWWDNLEDPDFIWVLDAPAEDLASGQRSNRFDDPWSSDLNEYGCEQAVHNGEEGPLRGFGKVWCDHPELQTRLGRPTEQELGSGGNPPFSVVQFYQGGVMIYNPTNSEVYVIFDQGDWLRFDD